MDTSQNCRHNCGSDTSPVPFGLFLSIEKCGEVECFKQLWFSEPYDDIRKSEDGIDFFHTFKTNSYPGGASTYKTPLISAVKAGASGMGICMTCTLLGFQDISVSMSNLHETAFFTPLILEIYLANHHITLFIRLQLPTAPPKLAPPPDRNNVRN